MAPKRVRKDFRLPENLVIAATAIAKLQHVTLTHLVTQGLLDQVKKAGEAQNGQEVATEQ